jgi:hypothetical protein
MYLEDRRSTVFKGGMRGQKVLMPPSANRSHAREVD